MASIDVEQLARAYGIDGVYDYVRPASGLVLTSGSGGMLAAMDALPQCRWAWILEGYTGVSDRMMSFAHALATFVDVVAVFAFYGMDRPLIAQQLLTAFDPSRVAFHSNVDLAVGRRAHTIDELTDHVAELCSA